MKGDLERQLAEMGPGDHLCHIYEDAAEQAAVFVPFVKYGLARGERCLYIADDRSARHVTDALASAGVNVPREIARGALIVHGKRDAYLRTGAFAPAQMLGFLA